jgi:threonylcarbamoyladenosine tRNA methylthiotransferase MtaB
MRFYFDLVGCRVNEAEIESMAAETARLGHAVVHSPEEADWIVVNTCTVTREAERDSRQKIRRAHARNGGAGIVAAGCWATVEPDAAAALPGVARVVSNARKDFLIGELLGSFAGRADGAFPAVSTGRRRTRAYIKAEDGCDNACAYCLIRVARGPVRSRPAEAILADVRAAGEAGAKEAVLAGVHLGAWGKDPGFGSGLDQLLETILEQTKIERLRISSLEPWDLRPGFFRLWRNPRLCPHLHLPLQSGCAATLRRMNRRTTPEDFAELLDAARAAIPDLAVTSDLMVGFPGEDDSEFRESVDFAARMGFARLHVFRFSPRPGTPAARMAGAAPADEIRHRSMWARHIGERGAAAFARSFIGREMAVLWEADTRSGLRHGLTGNFLRVRVKSGTIEPNTITTARLAAYDRGEMVCDG